ncbi:MAG TPA: dihydroorotase, partial [Ruminiclostridium sp.]|nr:dihydroorotase [Ruminiclostridium sp.]
MRILIKNGIVVNKIECGTMNILVEDGVITRIEQDLSAHADEVIDAAGCYVLPGLVDAHC